MQSIFDPRLSEPCFVTYCPKGVVTTLCNFNIDTIKWCCLQPQYRLRSHLSIHTKIITIITSGLKIAIFAKNRFKFNRFFFFFFFFAYKHNKGEMVFLTYPVSFSSLVCRFFFFQNGDLKFSGVVATPLLSNFDDLPFHNLWRYPRFVLFCFFFFFIKMTTKDELKVT